MASAIQRDRDSLQKDDTELADTACIEKAITVDGTIDVQLDKRLNRKFDLHILPWLFGIWYAMMKKSILKIKTDD